ncbi:hypothetical protein ACFVMC_26465 [Nocardia sp. NPDC127579]|uniref:hypothetical protein n=1 Tax=Nocardia sp. NPDC127579 TaxID=3345402 RepID=UPI0036312954
MTVESPGGEHAGGLVEEYRRSADPEVLDAAIELLRGETAGDRAARSHALASALAMKYYHCGERDVLEEAVGCALDAVLGAGTDDPRRYGYQFTFRQVQHRLLRVIGDVEGLRTAVEIDRITLEQTPEGADSTAQRCLLVHDLMELYELAAELPLLREASEILRNLLSDLPSDHCIRAGILYDHAGIMRRIYEHNRNPVALEHAVLYGSDAVAALPAGNLLHAQYNAEVALNLGVLATHTETAEVVAQALRYARAAATESGGASVEYNTLLMENLVRVGGDSALAEAVGIGRATAASELGDSPVRTYFLHVYGLALTSLYLATEPPPVDMLDDMLAVSAEVVAAVTPEDPERPQVSMFRALVLMIASMDRDSATPGPELAQVLGEVLTSAADGAERDDLLEVLRLLGTVDRIGDTSTAADLTAVTAAVARARTRIDDPAPESRWMVLSAMATVLMRLAAHTGDTAGLREAIDLGHQARIGADAADFGPPLIAAQLWAAWAMLLERAEDDAALAECARMAHELPALADADAVAEVVAAFEAAYDRSGRLRALDAAIEFARTAGSGRVDELLAKRGGIDDSPYLRDKP